MACGRCSSNTLEQALGMGFATTGEEVFQQEQIATGAPIEDVAFAPVETPTSPGISNLPWYILIAIGFFLKAILE